MEPVGSAAAFWPLTVSQTGRSGSSDGSRFSARRLVVVRCAMDDPFEERVRGTAVGYAPHARPEKVKLIGARQGLLQHRPKLLLRQHQGVSQQFRALPAQIRVPSAQRAERGSVEADGGRSGI